jgi:hypothetical protein
MQTPISDHPEPPDPLLKRVAISRPLDILMLPFEPGIVTADHYEEALILLYKKRWRFGKIRFMHYAFIAPALAMTFSDLPHRITTGILFKRLSGLIISLAGILWAMKEILAFAEYGVLFPLFCGVFVASAAFVHLAISKGSFTGWRNAYDRMDHGMLNSHYPKKKRRVKTAKKPLAQKVDSLPDSTAPPETTDAKIPVAKEAKSSGSSPSKPQK